VYFEKDIIESIDDIIGNKKQKERLEDFFNALKNYTEFSNKLKQTKLVPNLTMLLYGPPGTGKTSLTRAYSKEKGITICVVESDRLVSSLLGDTIKNIRNVVETSADIAKKNGPFILFFDEIDAIGSERSNVHEVGEIKRAVISFLQTIDKVNYEGVPLAIFGATNHQQQLDSAIWRRFTFHLEFDFPDFELRKKILESFLYRIKDSEIEVEKSIFVKLNEEYDKIQSIITSLEKELGKKKSEMGEDFIKDEIERNREIKRVLSLTHGYSGSDIERGTRVALFKAIGNYESLKYDNLYNSLKLVGGTKVHVERQDVLSSSIQATESREKVIPDIKIEDYNELMNQLPKIIPIIRDIYEIIKNKSDLKMQYDTRGGDLGDFLNILIEISKVLKTKNILKLN